MFYIQIRSPLPLGGHDDSGAARTLNVAQQFGNRRRPCQTHDPSREATARSSYNLAIRWRESGMCMVLMELLLSAGDAKARCADSQSSKHQQHHR